MDALAAASDSFATSGIAEKVSRIRHDLRNPLGSMIGYLEIIAEDILSEEDDPRQAVMDRTVRIINEMLAAINGALDAAKIEAGSVSIEAVREGLSQDAHRIQQHLGVLRSMPGLGPETPSGQDLLKAERCLHQLVEVFDLFDLLADTARSPASVLLPSAQADPRPSPKPGQRAFDDRPPIDHGLQSGSVLVVDDGEEYRDVVCRRLKRLGFTIHCAASGEEALSFVTKSSVDLILLDIVMPGLSGIETLARLKQAPATRDIPVIMLSSADDSGTVVECIKRGADDFVPKPVNNTVLKTRLEASLAKRRLKLASFSEGGFFYDRGTLRQDSPSYIERQSDHELFDGLSRGEYCYVLTSRQMGKSSLMVQTAARLRTNGIGTVVLDLTAIGLNVTPEQWYDGLALRTGQQLRLDDELDDFWRANERLSPVQRFFAALHDVVLNHVNRPIVIFVDELDIVRSLPFSTDEFFAAIRECHQRRAQDPVFSRLTFCLLGVATPFQLVRDSKVTPFNVARRVELRDFQLNEAAALARGFQRPPDVSEALLARVFYWTNGHPYLTQRLCRVIAMDPSVREVRDVDAACKRLFLTPRARDEDDNLTFMRRQLAEGGVDRAAALQLYRQVREGRAKVLDDTESQSASFLRLTGLVRSEEGLLVVRNRVYARAFDTAWIDQQEGK